jgi:predicted dehydrogenase
MAVTPPNPAAGASRPVRLCLATLEHDHAWWTLDHILATAGAELAAVADTAASRRERAARQLPPGCRVFSDPVRMLDECRPDGLVVTAPNNEHRALTEAAVSRHVHCFVQKPIASTYADAAAMVTAAQRAGVVLMVNLFPLWDPVKSELFRLVRDGAIGELRQLQVTNGHQGPAGISVLTPDYQRWLYDPLRHGGGALMDQATYGLAYAAWLLGRPGIVQAIETPIREPQPGRVDDIATVLLGYPRTQVQVIGSWAWPHRTERILCQGSAGRLELADDRLTIATATASINHEASPIAVEPTSDAARPAHGIAHFTAVLRGNGPVQVPHTPAISLLTAEITEAAQRSAQLSSVVTLEPAGGPDAL